MRFRVLLTVVYLAVGLLDPTLTFFVSDWPSWSSLHGLPCPPSSPASCENRFILSCAPAPLQSLQFSARPLPCGSRLLPQGFLPHRDTNIQRPLIAGFPHLLCSVLAVSHDPDGFLRQMPCGFVSPHNHVQGSLFRGFPSRTAEQTFISSCPPAVFVTLLPPTVSTTPDTNDRLQGFGLCENP